VVVLMWGAVVGFVHVTLFSVFAHIATPVAPQNPA
jgi:hypothetical protein